VEVRLLSGALESPAARRGFSFRARRGSAARSDPRGGGLQLLHALIKLLHEPRERTDVH
jgi:hypothetical protein